MLKINFVKDRVKPIRSTPEKLQPFLLALLLIVYGVTLGLGIVGYKSIARARSTRQNHLNRLKKQAGVNKKPAAEYTEEDKKLVGYARRLRDILTNRLDYVAVLTSISGSLPEQGAVQSINVEAGSRIRMTGVVASPRNARSRVWTFIESLKKKPQFSEQVEDINLQKATTIQSPPGLKFVIVAPLSRSSMQALIRTAH